MEIKKLESLEQIYDAFIILEKEFYSFDGDLKNFCKKIYDFGICYAAYDNSVCAIIAFYANDMESRTAYITSLLVSGEKRGLGIASKLLNRVKEHCCQNKFVKIRLEVKKDNIAAVSLYKKHLYNIENMTETTYYMELKL